MTFRLYHVAVHVLPRNGDIICMAKYIESVLFCAEFDRPLPAQCVSTIAYAGLAAIALIK